MRNQIKKKRVYLLVLLSILSGCILGCGGLENETTRNLVPSYESFIRDYQTAVKYFKPGSCTSVLTTDNLFSCINFPENVLDDSLNDNFEGNVLQPRNKKLLFIDSQKKILFAISYLYTDVYMDTDIITIDKLYPDLFNREIEYNDLTINPYCEYILFYKDSLILVNSIYLDQSTFSESEADYFNKMSSSFFIEFADFLNSQER